MLIFSAVSTIPQTTDRLLVLPIVIMVCLAFAFQKFYWEGFREGGDLATAITTGVLDAYIETLAKRDADQSKQADGQSSGSGTDYSPSVHQGGDAGPAS